jgi:hypothetical protein
MTSSWVNRSSGFSSTWVGRTPMSTPVEMTNLWRTAAAAFHPLGWAPTRSKVCSTRP